MAADEYATDAEVAQALAELQREHDAKHPVTRSEDAGVHPLIDLYDTEIVTIHEKVLGPLTERSGRSFLAGDWPRIRDSFEREVEGRFAEVGLVAKVVGWYVDPDDPLDNAPTPRIEISGRTDRIEFDHDQQVHEVVNDALGTGERGTVGKSKLWTPGSG